MHSFIRTAAAVVIAATISAAASAAVRVDVAEAMARTAVGTPTIESLISYAKKQETCSIVSHSDRDVSFSGHCFGFPGENGSRFEADGNGDVTVSEIHITDRTFAERLEKGLRMIAGNEQFVADFGLGWIVSSEIWRLKDLEGVMAFIRVKRTDEAKELRRLKERMDVLDRF